MCKQELATEEMEFQSLLPPANQAAVPSFPTYPHFPSLLQARQDKVEMPPSFP